MTRAAGPARSPRRRRTLWFALAAAASTFGRAPTARAEDDAARAAALFREARTLSEQGKHTLACPKFDESQKLDPSMGTEFYLAECLERIGDMAGAWVHYESVVRLARSAKMKDREAYASEHMEKVAVRVAFVRVMLTRETRALPGLVVRVAGREIPIEDASRVPVNVGEVAIDVRSEGRPPFVTTVQADTAGEVFPVQVTGLAGDAVPPTGEGTTAPPPGDEAPPPEDEADDGTTRTAMRTSGFIGIGLGGFAITLGTVFGITAFSDWSTFEDKGCTTRRQCPNEYDAADASATAANWSIGVGAVIAAVGISLVVFAPDAPQSSSVGVRLSASQAAIEGRFP